MDLDRDSIEQKHKKERKDLQAKVQAIKKSVPKGDKKRKKESAEEIARLEAELDQRHQAELEALESSSATQLPSGQNEKAEDLIDRLEITEEAEEKPQKLSKAQKRRNKKAQEDKDKAERIAAAEKDNVNSTRNVENKQFAALTAKRNLKIKQIPSDGHCLYNAVVHQLSLQGVEERLPSMRQKVSDHMRANQDEFLCFLTKPDTGDVFTPEEYQKYCDEVANTAAWGGHHEMKALTEVYRKPIEVLQAEGPVLNIGEQFNEQPIMLSYHRHAFGLGEHYNSVVPKETGAEASEEDT